MLFYNLKRNILPFLDDGLLPLLLLLFWRIGVCIKELCDEGRERNNDGDGDDGNERMLL